MNIKKLNEEINKVLNDKTNLLIDLLKEDKEVKIEGDTEFESLVKYGTYGEESEYLFVDGRYSGIVLVEEEQEDKWSYYFSYSLLKKAVVGKDEDGYNNYDYYPDYDGTEHKFFNTKEEAINEFVNYLLESFGEPDEVEEA